MVAFTEDASVRDAAEAFARDAVEFARLNFRLKLDWSDASVANIEKMLVDFDRQKKKRPPSEAAITGFSRMFGSYIGEVYRKNHGGVWGLVTVDEQSFPGMQTPAGNLFWPWGKVEKRMTNGPEDNVRYYYEDVARGRS